ncbi:MAG: hypothetical protein JOY60_08175 [Burkholderiaceae bacterium]|nr:hypothetical protein [Roseateles sp.]MBV8469819.1 hypothetical protein [Burkholderiaceae bacterium]
MSKKLVHQQYKADRALSIPGMAGCIALAACAVLPLGAHAQVSPGAALLKYTDIGQADILLTAASIIQSNGNNLVGSIDQTLDTSTTDRSLYPLGNGNIADVEQTGSYNSATIVQNGNLNQIRVIQSGSSNTVNATQIGVGNYADISQSGSGNTLTTYQNGTGNIITASQLGNSAATLQEIGDNNVITLNQLPGIQTLNVSNVTLRGSGLRFTVSQ